VPLLVPLRQIRLLARSFEEHFNALVGLPPDQWKALMYSVSMTTRLGLATVVGTIAIVILAHSKDQASTPKQCKVENCAVSTNIGQSTRKKIPKSTQLSRGSADGQMILNKKNKSVQAIVVNGSADKPVSKKPALRLVKKSAPRLVRKSAQRLVEKSPQLFVDNSQRRVVEKSPQRLVEKSPQPVVENPQYRRLRRADDPFLESFN
jgi:hypothetical protein